MGRRRGVILAEKGRWHRKILGPGEALMLDPEHSGGLETHTEADKSFSQPKSGEATTDEEALRKAKTEQTGLGINICKGRQLGNYRKT